MKRKTVSLLLALLCLTGCAKELASTNQTTIPTVETTVPQTTPPPETTEPTIQPTTEPEPVYVSPLAVEDYLLPIEEYSWERQFAPEYVMVHFISAIMTNRDDPYNLAHVRDIFVQYNTSVHYIIERDGTVHCYVPEDRVAWHAGAGDWKDEERFHNSMNQYAIGIELVAMGSEADMSVYMSGKEYRSLDQSLMGFTQEQYDSLKLLVEDICQRNGIPMDRDHVIGHEEYSPKKTDPGDLFDWSQLIP